MLFGLLRAEQLRKFEKPLLIVAGAAALTAVLVNLDFNLLEANLYDLRASHGHQPKPDTNIVLVTIDDRTTNALDEFAPLSLDSHVKFLETLEKLEPKAVGYLVDFFQVNQANPEFFKKEWGKRFVDSVSRLENRGTSVLLGTAYDVTGEVVPPFPLGTLPHSLALIHNDGNVFSRDKITRRALTRLYDRPVFHMELAQKLGFVAPNQEIRGTFYVPEVEARYFFFRYHGPTALRPEQPYLLPYQRISLIDILENRVPAETIRGKILLVGTLSKHDTADFTLTPYNKGTPISPKLVVHANILDAMIHNQGIIRVPVWVGWIITFAATAFVIGWVMSSTPITGVFATIGLALAVLLFSQILYSYYDLWIRVSQPLVGIFLGYYLIVPYRLIREYKKRSDYQQKNIVLTQVEELKRNFLSLVTHDLKTPVARIQGLAEVLLRKSSDRLIERDQQTLNHIIDSTDELNRFISSILELSKLESNRLTLNLESKDVNQLIERSVEGFKAQARTKKVVVETNLEPLFPIRLDSSLISKVLNNLIDNAIKYSPQDSVVSVESREKGEFVEISVRDQGIGLSEEDRSRLFTRFFRAKNDATAQIHGTGLGLYLTKYFVEAHGGRVEVESEPGEGSTFRIYLSLHEIERTSQSLNSSTPPKGLTRVAQGLRNGGKKIMKTLSINKEKSHV